MTDTMVERLDALRSISTRLNRDERQTVREATDTLKAQASRIAELEGVLKELDLFFEFERPGLVIAENRGISFRRMSDAFQAAHKALRGKSLERIVCKHGIEDVRCDDCYGEGLANGL